MGRQEREQTRQKEPGKALKGRWHRHENLKAVWQLIRQRRGKDVLTRGTCVKVRMLPIGEKMAILAIGQGSRGRGTLDKH